jgi:lipopolysaccharide transport system permease protein
MREMVRYRYLIYVFTARDLLARYKQTFIGILWAIIQPLFLMLVFTVIFSKFLGVSTGGVPYPVFSYVALLPWTFLNRSITASAESLLNFKHLITKIYFPREIAPLSVVVSSFVDFTIGFLVFLAMLIYYHIPITANFLFIILLIPLQIMIAAGFSLFLSSVTVIIQDLKFALPLFMQVLMYASPIIYSVTNIKSSLKAVFYLNPLVGVIEGYRQTILFGKPPLWDFLGISFLFAIVFFFFGYWVFKKLEPYVIDII